MKKILKTLLFTIAAFCLLINANAAELTKGNEYKITAVEHYSSGNVCTNCFAWYDDNKQLHQDSRTRIVRYKLADSYSAYCLDAHLDNSNNKDIKVTEVIDSNSSSFSAYYAGLAVLGTKGYSETQTSGYGVSENDFYAATSLALRMYAISMGSALTTGSDKNLASQVYTYSLSNTAALWMKENKDLANSVKGLNCSTESCFWQSFGLSGKDAINRKTDYSSERLITDGTNAKVLKATKEMFIDALEAADNYNKNGTIGVSSATISENTTLATQKETTDTKFIQKDYYTITVSEFTDKDNINSLGISCTNCNSVAGNPKVAITGYSLDNGATFTSGVPTDEKLKELTSNDNIIIEVTGEIDKNSGYKCDDIKYDITYNFKSASVQYKVYILREYNGDSENKGAQRFYAIVTDSNVSETGTPVKASRTINFCGNSGSCLYQDPSTMSDEQKEECCDDWDNACTNDSNSSYCDYYGSYCACDTEIVVPTVCEYDKDGNTGEAIAKDMTGYTKSAQQDTDSDGVGDTDNVKVCLLARKKDDAGNSYQAMSNNYCQVYCKEDFQFNFPTGVSVNSGTYFQLEATITGTKTCYTSKIDVAKYNSDLASATSESEKNQINQQYNACVNMEVNYDCFEPVIEYEYDEVYNDLLNSDNNTFQKLGENVTKDVETTYCGDIEDDYDCVSGTELSKGNNGINYVKSTITKSATYKTPSVFYQQRPNGNITLDANTENAVVIDGLPVAQNTKKDRYTFTLSLKDIGEFYDQTNCALGRLIGAENSIYNTKYKDKDNNSSGKATYQCYYDVNCPECDFDCEGPLCDIEQCDGVNCTATCLGNGCAYDTEAGLSYAYRTISLNNLNPSSRDLGYNWDAEKSVKAAAAISEIEATGEDVYEDAEYTVTLTPALISYLKEHNNNELANGGYANDSLVFEDYEYNGVTYAKLNGKSTLLEELANGQYSSNITLPSDENRFNSWLESEYCQNNVCTTKNGIGPAYK